MQEGRRSRHQGVAGWALRWDGGFVIVLIHGGGVKIEKVDWGDWVWWLVVVVGG